MPRSARRAYSARPKLRSKLVSLVRRVSCSARSTRPTSTHKVNCASSWCGAWSSRPSNRTSHRLIGWWTRRHRPPRRGRSRWHCGPSRKQRWGCGDWIRAVVSVTELLGRGEPLVAPSEDPRLLAVLATIDPARYAASFQQRVLRTGPDSYDTKTACFLGTA